MRKVSLLIILIALGCSKKSETSPQEPQNPTFSNYDILQYWGFGVGKTHKYYENDTVKLNAKLGNQSIIDSTIALSDTFLRVIKDTFADLNVVFYDSSYSNQTKIYDTFYVYKPFVIDTIRTFNLFNNSFQTSIANKISKAPLSSNDSWTPIEPQSILVNDTFKISTSQLGACTLWVYVDTFKIENTNKSVIEVGSDSSFKLLSTLYSKVKYRYQTKPKVGLCSDTTMKMDTAYTTSIDTTYLKAYLGITRSYTFDSTIAQFATAIPVQAIFKHYARRIRIP